MPPAGTAATAPQAAGKQDPGGPPPGKAASGVPGSAPAGALPSSGPKAEPGVHWTLQVVSTPDQTEAQRVAVKVRAAGFPAAVVADKGLYKVRLTSPGTRDAVDATALKLKARGFKPFAIKVE